MAECSHIQPQQTSQHSDAQFSSDNDVIQSVEDYLRGKMNSCTRLEYRSYRNDEINAIKFAEIAQQNELVNIVVLCLFIYEAENIWDNPQNNHNTCRQAQCIINCMNKSKAPSCVRSDPVPSCISSSDSLPAPIVSARTGHSYPAYTVLSHACLNNFSLVNKQRHQASTYYFATAIWHRPSVSLMLF